MGGIAGATEGEVSVLVGRLTEDWEAASSTSGTQALTDLRVSRSSEEVVPGIHSR